MDHKQVSIKDCWVLDHSSIPKLSLNEITNGLVYDINVRIKQADGGEESTS